MPTDAPESAHHEESETYQDSAGRWQNYYGSGPGKGLRIPLEQGTSYATSGDAGMAAQARSMMGLPDDQPTEQVPGLKEVAAGIVGKSPQQILEEAPKPPTSDDVRAAQGRLAEAQAAARKGQTGRAEAEKAQIDALTLETQAFQAKSSQVAERARQGPQGTPPPSRGLRPFLASSEKDPPENVVAKLMQAISLFATMAGGGKTGARASLSALTGALEGWQAGDRARADRAYADWKAKTDQMMDQFETEMRGYQIALRSEAVPIEQRMRLLDLEARNNQNATLAENAGVTDAQKWVDELQKRQDHYVNLSMDVAKLDALKREADRKFEQQERHFFLELDKKGQLLDLKRELGMLQAQQKSDAAEAKVKAAELASGQKVAAAEAKATAAEAKAARGAPTPPGQMTKLEDIADARMQLNEMSRLAGKVDLNKLAGGIRPWINQVIQTQSVGGFPVKWAGTLTEDERRFLTITQNYADVILRQRSGTAAGAAEMTRMLKFLPDEHVTPESLNTRIRLFSDLQAGKQKIIQGMLTRGGYRDPTDPEGVPNMAPSEAKGGDTGGVPKGAHREGNQIVSDSGKYVWDGKAWQARK